MEVVASVEVPVSPEVLFSYISDLANYPRWLELVHSASAVDDLVDKTRPTWQVELQARIGVFARSKRLRMTRTICEAPNLVVFERNEQDSRKHAEWVLRATVNATPVGAELVTNLNYSGKLFTNSVLERALADQIKTGREKLIQQLSAR